MKIGYIASSIFRHTFEINEVVELLRQKPDTTVYSFHRPSGTNFQSRRVQEINAEIVTWSAASAATGFLRMLFRHPLATLAAAAGLAARSVPNPVYWFKNTAAFFLAMPILAHADKNGVTHLHANFGSSPATVAWLGKKILKTGMSITFHAFDIYADSLAQRDPLKKHKLRDADLVVAVHSHGLEHLRALVPWVSGEKFKTIRISVVFSPAEKSPSPAAPPLLVAAGNLVPKKGFDVLIEAAGILRRQGIPVRVRILGEGPQREFLESLITREALTGVVELPGYYQHGEFARHLAEAAALVVPSKVVKGGQRDGIPTVLVEAWLARTPVVASLVGGMSEVVSDEVTGLVFPPGDAGALAVCLRRLLESETLRTALVENGLRKATEEFAPGKNVTALAGAIQAASPRRSR